MSTDTFSRLNVNGWKQSSLESLLKISIGGIWGEENGISEIDVDVVRVTELKAHGVIEPSTAAKRSITKKQLLSRALEVGDLLLEKSGGGPNTPVGRVGYVLSIDKPTVCSNFMQLMRPDTEQVLPLYLHLFLTFIHSNGETIPLQTSTTNIRNIKTPDYMAVKVPIPSLSEQEKIVEFLEEQLSRLDAALASVNAVRKKAARFRRSILQAGFNGELTGHDASTGLTPDGWKNATIAEVADFIRGVTYQKSDARREPEDGFLPLLRATNIGNESLSYDEFVFVPKRVVKPEQLIRINDMVIAASSGSISIVGKSAPVLVDFEATFGAFCAVLRPQSSISPNFFRLYVQSPICRETWSNLARGTNINNLKREQVLTTSIPVPPLDEQEKIAEILDEQISHLDAAFAVADAIEKNASAMRRSLLHAAFTGELTKQWREDAHV
jgi:type I restriction enzyme S subunit